jgi:hypothetical protein
MHPLLIQAIAVERARELHADAAAASRAGRFRRSRQDGRAWRDTGGRTLVRLAAARPLRGPRPA